MKKRLTFLRCGWVVVFSIVFGLQPIAYANLTALSSAADWLESQQQLDGSWGSTDEIKYISTAESVTALRVAGRYNDAYFKGITWLENHAAVNVDYQSRSVSGLYPHGDDLSHSLQEIINAQDIDSNNPGGWGISGAYIGSAIDTALVLQAFEASAYSGDLSDTVQYLKAVQGSGQDAGWKVSESDEIDVVSTALVIRALTPYEATYTDIPAMLDNAASAFVTHVTTTSGALQLAHTILALNKTGRQLTHAGTLEQELLSRQGPNSDWENDVYVTSVAIQALATVNGIDSDNLASDIAVPDRNLRLIMNQSMSNNAMDKIRRIEAQRLTSFDNEFVSIDDTTGLEEAVNLTSLTLTNSGLTDTGFVANMVQLESLDLRHNSLSSLSSISNLVNLKELDLRNNQFTSSGLQDLAGLPNLERVNVQFNSPLAFEFLFSSPEDTDGDGAADFQEFRAATNIWHENSHPVFGYIDDEPLPFTFTGLPSGSSMARDAWSAAWEDFDADGDYDVVVYVHGGPIRYESMSCDYDCWYYSYSGVASVSVYENVGGTYQNRPMNAGEHNPESHLRGMIAYDYDNDGKKDLLIARANNPGYTLFRNDTGEAGVPAGLHFSDVTGSVIGALNVFTLATAVMDANHDGYTDIVTSTNVTGARLQLWTYDPVNNKYIDSTSASGFSGLLSNTGRLVAADFDLDGVMDILMLLYDRSIELFRGKTDGTFTTNESVTVQITPNINYVEEMLPYDYNQDGFMDLVLFETKIVDDGQNIDYGGYQARLLKNTPEAGNVGFSEDLEVSGLDVPGSSFDWLYSGGVGDYNNDGEMDVIMASGYSTQPTLFRGDDQGVFTVIDNVSGLTSSTGNTQYGFYKFPVLVDTDSDGYQDLLMPGSYGKYSEYMFKNLESGSHWLEVKLVGDTVTQGPVGKSTLEAVGAWVGLVAPSVGPYYQHYVPRSGSAGALHFGLGTIDPNQTIDIHVLWPSGLCEIYSDEDIDQRIVLEEGNAQLMCSS